MWRQLLLAVAPLAALVALPVVLRPPAAAAPAGGGVERLTIVTPHSESIRHEFERAFVRHYRATTGRDLVIDWRTNGTSDIVKYLNDQYRISFRHAWTADAANGPWSDTVKNSFDSRRIDLKQADLDPLVRRAREQFLASAVGVGIDLFFGGGQYEMQQQAEMGHAVDAGLLQTHPEWFTPATIPERFSGEIFYDRGGRYFGCCLATFGICYNVDRVATLGDGAAPSRWADLGEPRFFRQIAIADPTKSGSINKCFEMIVQQQMAAAAAQTPGPPGLAAGWANGLNLIKRLAGNARYVTDSASKVAHDVAQGNTAAGICIDSYGRAEGEWSAEQSGRERLKYVTPAGGTSVSADPIQLLRGAPNRAAAVAFIEFVLSVPGQQLWNYRRGTPGGPAQYVLRRLPVRRDLYGPAHREQMADPDVNPYEQGAGFEYQGAWTGPYFGLLRVMVRSMALDPLPELQAAWGAIVRAGGPARVPEALAAFDALPFAYAQANAARDRLDAGAKGQSVLTVLGVQRDWAEFFRAHYRRAAELARAGR